MKKIIILIFVILLAIYFAPKQNLLTYCQIEKCPFCYGTSFCPQIQNGNLVPSLFFHLGQLINAKNVNFATYNNNQTVIIKKLAHNTELNDFFQNLKPNTKIETSKIFDFLSRKDLINFKSCNRKTSEIFIEKALNHFNLEEIWTMINVNVEPLILHLFQGKDWPLARSLGSCGLLTIQEYRGETLNNFKNAKWKLRVEIAIQLLEAAVNFTKNHDSFRLYLTDISSDNIVVDHMGNVAFIDLEHVILNEKGEGVNEHHSMFFDDDDFVYSEDEVCNSSISDHNVYAVCKLLLSKKAPWPMMQNGLLHSPPTFNDESINIIIDDLFKLIELCVDSDYKYDRFSIADELIQVLKDILDDWDQFEIVK